MSSSSDALTAVEGILADGGDVDELLRRVVAALHDAGYAWAGLYFVEEGALTLGPEAGAPDKEHRTSVPVRWQGDTIAELAVDGAAPADTAFLEQVAELVSSHCLVGWDTGGEPWES
jgi:putative methionine-R-sulfoxide reductase with GAF domain